jgi:ribosomal protein L9
MEANDDGSLYGAVSQKSVSESIFSSLEIKISPDAVILDPIKELGKTEVQVSLYEDIKVNLYLEITKKT